ncbi:DUF2552 family protein [Bacillus sp. CLL-7-23]|uniref:DUF2552 family protein n=2 Tax=Bacillus changyiensis TaxID=3004103 RepID=A0ABT4X463_9BACI|nr:DUF2552 family protein [Bacillus changyiensis]MDA7027075.1 DUF2552 family protein [Bacillus changyiensis]
MKQMIKSLQQTAQNKTWVSFLHQNHPYSLLHWSIGGTESLQKDVWLLQDEMTFETKEFDTIEAAIVFISENMSDITDIL